MFPFQFSKLQTFSELYTIGRGKKFFLPSCHDMCHAIINFQFSIFNFYFWHAVCPIYRRKAHAALKKINRRTKPCRNKF